MATYQIIPFTAQITRDDHSGKVAAQMQQIIDRQVADGWEYSHMDTVQTAVAATKGCFGIGAQPGYLTSYNVLVFRK